MISVDRNARARSLGLSRPPFDDRHRRRWRHQRHTPYMGPEAAAIVRGVE